MSSRDETVRIAWIGLVAVVTAVVIIAGFSLAGSLPGLLDASGGGTGEVNATVGSYYLDNAGQPVVVGEVYNGLDVGIGSVVVTVTIYEDGEPVDEVHGAPMMGSIPGDTTVPFELRVNGTDGEPGDIDVDVSYMELDADIAQSLTVVDAVEVSRGQTSVTVAGTVANDGDDEVVRPLAVVTFYDENGTVLGVRSDRVDPSPLVSGEDGDFQVRYSTDGQVPSLALEYEYFEVIVYDLD